MGALADPIRSWFLARQSPALTRTRGETTNRLIPPATLPYVWMLLGAMSFSVMAALTHALSGTYDWRVIAATRTLLAFLFATTLAVSAGARLVVWRPRTLWVRSIAGSISLVCTFYALTHLPVADVLTLTNVFPIWVALLSWPLLGEFPRAGSWIAIGVALLGVALVEQPHLQDESSHALAATLALVSSLTTSVSMMGLHRLQQVDPRAIVAHFSAVAFLVCLGALAIQPPSSSSDACFEPQSLTMLLAVGISATIGQLFLTKAFAAGPPAKVSVVALSQVAFGMLFDVAIWNREFSIITLVGIVLVMAPTAWLLISQGQWAVDDL